MTLRTRRAGASSVRTSVRTKQVAGVTAIVFAVVAALSTYYLVSLAGVLLAETRTTATLIASGVFQRLTVLAGDGGDLRQAIATDSGLRSMLDLSVYAPHAVYAAVVDRDGRIIAHNDPTQVGRRLPSVDPLEPLVEAGGFTQMEAIFRAGGLTREVRQEINIDTGNGPQAFGAIRVGVSTLLIRHELEEALRPAAITAIILLVATVLVAMLLARWLLKPILLLRAGLDRLGQGEQGVTLDLHPQDEFGEIGESFNVVAARLAREEAEGRQSRDALSRRLAALGRVSSGIAHEVKNPLNAMRIHLELLRMRSAGAPETREHVDVLAAQLARLDEVVQGFLNFTRTDDLRIRPVEPLTLLNEVRAVVEAQAASTGITVEVTAAPGTPTIDGDAPLLHQALLNLAINACQAMPGGGRLRLAAAKGPESTVRLSIEDTGTGIAPEHLDKIFNLYFTTKPEGSGIGLALVFRTVHLHNGDITVQSVPGTGTTFTITLPATRA